MQSHSPLQPFQAGNTLYSGNFYLIKRKGHKKMRPCKNPGDASVLNNPFKNFIDYTLFLYSHTENLKQTIFMTAAIRNTTIHSNPFII